MAITKSDGVTVGNCQMLTLRGVDWCHLCGSREHPLVEVHSPENAEHPKNGRRKGGPYENVTRICRQCGEAVAKLLAEPPATWTAQREETLRVKKENRAMLRRRRSPV